jgi:rare lipoprotein A
LRRVLTHSVYALLLLGGTMGAAPGHNTSAAIREPVLPPLAPKKLEAPATPAKPYQVGKASWYGGFFQGRETANGDKYNMYDLTAAHKELPLGTFVKVTNLKNLRSVIVRINDRGPVTPGRIIDLSYSAARSLDIAARGLQKVRIDIVDPQSAEMAMMAAQPKVGAPAR